MWNSVRGRLRGLARRTRKSSVRRNLMRRDSGMTTSEYAMGTIAACAFAAVLYKVVTSGAVSGALQSVIGKALNAQF
ncbi:DUF4244 domain-containing protein [Streptomyces sp. CA-135486]|uniref:DUF4244 domain-containing protein n=1 Tax=Streptomyces sp. CA-135486 TaxID=3240049 RepID=UPI003D8C71B3